MISVKNKTKESADAYIYEEITSSDFFGGTSCKGFKDEIESLVPIKHLNLYINSPGGDVFEGLAIANFLKRQKFEIDVYVDGIAASIASVIAIGCGGRLHMYENSIIMIHKAWCCAAGNSDELKKISEQLEECDNSIFSMYKDRKNDSISDDELKEMIKNETWLDAQQCLEIGFAFDIIRNEKKIAAKLDSKYCNRFSHIPENLISESSNDIEDDNEIKKTIENANKILKLLNY